MRSAASANRVHHVLILLFVVAGFVALTLFVLDVLAVTTGALSGLF